MSEDDVDERIADHSRRADWIHRRVREDPDRTRGYRRAEQMRRWAQDEVARWAADKEDILLAASEERGQGPAALTELAGGVTRQLTSRMIGNARTRRSESAVSEPGEGETA